MDADILKEKAFESVVENSLTNLGFIEIDRLSYNKEKALFAKESIIFIKATQPKEWQRLESLLGENTEEQVVNDLCKWMDTYGSLATMRHGFKCYGRQLHIAFFRAAHNMNPELEENYSKNTLGITRQLQYSTRSTKSLDITLSLNGIPIATMELKNPITGQNADSAKHQYKNDRDPREIIFEFKRRTLIHFAVDTEQVFMTTRLAGDATYFLPFNKGFKNGAGNPPDENKRNYKTAYLWEEVLQRDSLLDLLARFIHLQIEEIFTDEGRKVKKETLVFPRYHQLKAVRRLVQVSEQNGVGNNYLIEHSAGSGKSNTIAWLVHRLASLHKSNNDKVFDSVVVITDRVVLDKQLQETIYQFEHKRGVVQKIDENSKQLAEALKNSVPIIITTLQKFPFVSQQLIKIAEERGQAGSGVLSTKKFAVVVDEAHSSQSGEGAADLKEVLGGDKLLEEAKRKAEEEGSDNLEELYRSMAKRGKQSNISFFAFTATPKHKTLAVFGNNGEAFDRYTMKQAMEEGFIMDVLKNFTTYTTYYKLLVASETDPRVERKKAAKALSKFMKLHPHNIAQKTQIMVEHFYQYTRHRIGGHAKAMVVTGSRLEAIRYKLGFDQYIKGKGYAIKTLVAFSGVVIDDKLKAVTYTEEGMNNGIKERELPEKFGSPEFSILLVADKYQTGFDQPLMHTMYVDKRLSGIQAVQTLSRLNRIHPLKEDTFVLDFVNDREEIRKSFRTYYEGAEMGEEADPAQLYQLQVDLNESGIYQKEEVDNFCSIYFKPKQKQSLSDHQAINASLDQAVSRFSQFMNENEDEAELWRSKAIAYKNLYAFLSQVIPYQDSDLEKLFVFIRHLSAKLLRRKAAPNYDFDDTLRLEYYRLQKISDGSISLQEGQGYRLDGPTEVGTGMVHEDTLPLSRLVDIANARFGTDFNQADQYFFDQIVETAILDENLIHAAEVNPEDKFELVFKNLLQNLFVERIDQNEEIFSRFMNDNSFQKLITTWLASQAYKKILAKDKNKQ
jgi:type I restriction enzyme R subunit